MCRMRQKRRWRTTPFGSPHAVIENGRPASSPFLRSAASPTSPTSRSGRTSVSPTAPATRCSAFWCFAIVIFATGFPLAYYAARYNIDLDLITRGSGFGYYGSVVSNVIFATFTFIFFALEGSIMAQGLKLGLHIPLPIGYAISTLMVIPLVIFGMKALSKLQVWTTPLWLFLMVVPMVYLLISHPDSVSTFFAYGGQDNQSVNFGSIMLAAGVCLSLIAQIAEQIDYLRFMPPKTPENNRRWWRAVILAGPGWVFFGAIKQIIGLFLAVYIISNIPGGAAVANQPVHQFLEIYKNMMPAWLAMTLAVILVVISQIKINVTNAYSGSLAWTNSFTRITKHYPGPTGLRHLQPGHRAGPDGTQHVRLPQHHPGLLRQLRYGLGRHRGGGHRLQQVPAQALAQGAGVPARHALRHQPGRVSVRC